MNNRPFHNRTTFNHSNTKLVLYSELHCNCLQRSDLTISFLTFLCLHLCRHHVVHQPIPRAWTINSKNYKDILIRTYPTFAQILISPVTTGLKNSLNANVCEEIIDALRQACTTVFIRIPDSYGIQMVKSSTFIVKILDLYFTQMFSEFIGPLAF